MSLIREEGLKMKLVTVFFDFEWWWEVPYKKSDIESSINNILNILNKYSIKAVFCTAGIIAEAFPKVVKKLYDEGHEIASHGYRHENFILLREDELDKILAKTEKLIKGVIREKIIGIRSPWLCHDAKIYSVFKERGYKWVSNRHMVFPEFFDRPEESKRGITIYSLAKIISELKYRFLWKNELIKFNDLLEIPVFSTLETDLISIVPPEQKTPTIWLDYAYNTLKKQFLKSKKYFNLNFHPWLIGSSNRPLLLDRILNFVSSQKNVRFVLARELVEKQKRK